MILLCLSLIALFIPHIVMLLYSVSSKKKKKKNPERGKSSPHECGFDPKGSARLQFSLRFFLINMIFLIFYVEITLLLPAASVLTVTSIFSWLFTSTLFLMILLLGLYYEWKQGHLEWSS